MSGQNNGAQDQKADSKHPYRDSSLHSWSGAVLLQRLTFLAWKVGLERLFPSHTHRSSSFPPVASCSSVLGFPFITHTSFPTDTSICTSCRHGYQHQCLLSRCMQTLSSSSGHSVKEPLLVHVTRVLYTTEESKGISCTAGVEEAMYNGTALAYHPHQGTKVASHVRLGTQSSSARPLTSLTSPAPPLTSQTSPAPPVVHCLQ